MTEKTGLTSMGGMPLTLVGDAIHIGDPAPDFKALDNDLQVKSLSDYIGRVVVITALPSLDTPVCDLEARRFNSEAAALSRDLVILAVSMDLPFAQKRWCGARGVDRVITLSDHRDASFGLAYGVLIKELRLLARAVFVVDREGVVRYAELTPDLAHEPDYHQALQTAYDLL